MISDGLPLLGLGRVDNERFRSTRSGRLPKPPQRDRAVHGGIVLGQIDDVVGQISELRRRLDRPAEDAAVTAEGPNLDDPAVMKQIAPATSAAELLVSDTGKVVFRPGDDLTALRRKAEAYLREDTSRGNPRYNSLVARIEAIRLATISDLSLDEIPDDISDDEVMWVEIWTQGGPGDAVDRSTIAAAVNEFARLRPGATAVPVFHGQERDIHLLTATGEMLKLLPQLLPQACEVHRAPTVFPIILAEMQDEEGAVAEVFPPPENAAVVAIHDSGIDADHPYIVPVLLGTESVVPGEPAAKDTDGHGTQMAGVAAYSRLAAGVAAGLLEPDAWLVSVRLLESAAEAGGDPERGVMWAERTTESISAAEAQATGLPIIHNMSIGADNPTVGRTERTSWSVACDLLGWNSGQGRLLVVATGNAETICDRQNYPYVNLGPPGIQQPGQAWNVLTVGGYTALDRLTPQDVAARYPDPLAAAGELSPHSRTSLPANRPIKPEIVMEAGNTAPGGSLENPEAQGLSILTLRASTSQGGSLLRRTYKTSPAAAAASNALARLASAHPELRPATWRALLVHTAVWPAAAMQQLPERRDRLRSFGYGVPRVEQAGTSSSNRPVMIFEGSLRPSGRAGSAPDRRADFIEIPLPDSELQELGSTQVDLTVTLSYFIEPTDNLTRRAYAGGRLRWDLQGPTETAESFRARINRLVRDDGVPVGGGSYPWDISSDERSHGSLQQSRARVAAVDVAGTRLLGVYPVVGEDVPMPVEFRRRPIDL